MSKISINLWYDKEAGEAAERYQEIFPDTHISTRQIMSDTPSGEVEIIGMEIMGIEFTLMSAGPVFKPNPSISFHVPCYKAEEVDRIYGQLLEGGKELMELGEYPFSPRYGWVEDKYGFTWQVIMVEEGSSRVLKPALMFTNDNVGKAEEAIEFYTKIFRNAETKAINRYPAGMEPDKEGNVMYAELLLEGQTIGLMESSREHEFGFNEAISLMINCEDQTEINYYWEKLSHHPEAEQCGWLKDKYGVSWQVIPKGVDNYLSNPKVVQTFLQMKKVDISMLEKAIGGKL